MHILLSFKANLPDVMCILLKDARSDERFGNSLIAAKTLSVYTW